MYVIQDFVKQQLFRDPSRVMGLDTEVAAAPESPAGPEFRFVSKLAISLGFTRRLFLPAGQRILFT